MFFFFSNHFFFFFIITSCSHKMCSFALVHSDFATFFSLALSLAHRRQTFCHCFFPFCSNKASNFVISKSLCFVSHFHDKCLFLLLFPNNRSLRWKFRRSLPCPHRKTGNNSRLLKTSNCFFLSSGEKYICSTRK